MGTSSTKAKNKYNKSNYDRVNLVVSSGMKEQIKEAASGCKESVNAYINYAIKARMANEGHAGEISTVADKELSADFCPESFRFSVFYNSELVADVDVQRKNVNIRRYTFHPAKQIFYADELPRHKLGEILELRCWDKDRVDINDCLNKIGLCEYNPYEICRRTHGITYADRIWFRYDGEYFDGIRALKELTGV